MITFRETSREEWDEIVQNFDQISFPQSWQWGDVQNELGHIAHRYAIYKDEQPVGLVLAVEKHAKRGRFLEIPSGPLIDWSDKEVVDQTIQQLKILAKKQRCVLVRLRPQLHDNPAYHDLMRQIGLTQSPMHLMADHTSIIDLSPDLDTLLTNMRQQTRYEIRRAPKRGVTVSVDNSEEMIEQFHQLQVETAKRQGFFPPHPKHLAASVHQLGDNARVYRADKDDTLLNFALVIDYGTESAYFEAASTPESRREPGAYALIWQAMCDARERGMKTFNLWGTAPPDQPEHRFAGVTTFKRGFGGDDVAFVPAYDIVTNPLLYRLNHALETVRKKRRKL